jgi:cytochrome b subunit of formate dehydrogenase
MSRDAAKKHHARWYEEELAVQSQEESGTSEGTPARDA